MSLAGAGSRPKRLGLIVNPLAGIGGSVGLKGSDGAAVQQRALALGAIPHSGERAAAALRKLATANLDFDLFTAPGKMGEDIARSTGFVPQVLSPGEHLPAGAAAGFQTSAEDTRRAAQVMQEAGVDLILFAGGDGTARDLCAAVTEEQAVLGIPAGVKIQSAAFAVSASSAGELAALFLQGRARLKAAEVVDLDEEVYREGQIITRLYGLLTVPYQARLVQNRKAPTPPGEAAQAGGIAEAVVEGMRRSWQEHPGWLFFLGPGTTTRAIAERLGLAKTLLGVDVIGIEGLLVQDANEARLLELLAERPARIIVTPLGGQGFLFGRGNQQISPQVIHQVGRENIWVVSLPEKLAALRGQPLLVDTGDPRVDVLLAGFLPVITGYRERSVYRLAA